MEKENLRDLGTDGRLLKYIIGKHSVMKWTGLIWLSISTSWELGSINGGIFIISISTIGFSRRTLVYAWIFMYNQNSYDIIWFLRHQCRNNTFIQEIISSPSFWSIIYGINLRLNKPHCKVGDEGTQKEIWSELWISYAEHHTNPAAFVSIYRYK
jgi:hypothetical protein